MTVRPAFTRTPESERCTRTLRCPVRLGVVAFLGLLFFSTALALLVEGSAIAASPRVGVAKFRGPGEAAVRSGVMKAAAAKQYQVIGADQIERTAKDANVSLGDASGCRVVARALGLSAIVTGEVNKRARP